MMTIPTVVLVVMVVLMAFWLATSREQAATEPLTGLASWYGEKYRGARMANGQRFDPSALTAASWDFPLGTRVLVRGNRHEVVVVITDRGPTRLLREKGRVIDLSEAAFRRLAHTDRGLLPVIVEAAR